MSTNTLTCFSTARLWSATPLILTLDARKAACREDGGAWNRFLKVRMISMLLPRVLSHWTARRGKRKRMKQIRACAWQARVRDKVETVFYSAQESVFNGVSNNTSFCRVSLQIICSKIDHGFLLRVFLLCIGNFHYFALSFLWSLGWLLRLIWFWFSFCRNELFCRCCVSSGHWRMRGGNGLHGVAEEKGDIRTPVHTALRRPAELKASSGIYLLCLSIVCPTFLLQARSSHFSEL